MIAPTRPTTTADVAAHYDELDRFYREVWGEHVHHGLWRSRRETPEVAARNLIEVVAEAAAIGPGARVCDIGCGYGGTARVLARERGASVTALTISPAQHARAIATEPGCPNPTYLLRDWLENDLPGASFDAAIAIESSEHMADLAAFFAEAARVLRPGGRLVVCAWLARERANRREVRHLLEPICREGRLRQLGTADDYGRLAREAGLAPVAFRDVSRRVKKTWPVCLRRVAAALALRRDYRRVLLRERLANKVFLRTMLRIWLAYELGSLRYGILTAARPDAS